MENITRRDPEARLIDPLETEKALREYRTTLSLAMQGARMGAWRRNLKTNEVWWGRELEEIFGLEAGGFVGTENGFFDFVHPDDRLLVSRAVEHAVMERTDYIVEFRFRHADGSTRWMEGRGKAIYAKSGEPVELYGIGLDITGRKRDEQALRELEERFGKAFHANPNAMSLNSLPDGRYIDVNEAMLRDSGCTREEVIGKTALETGFFPDTDKLDQLILEVLEQGTVRNRELRLQSRHNGLRTVLFAAETITMDEQLYVLCTSTDITERKAMEQQLRLSEESLEKTVRERTAALEQANYNLARTNEELERFAYVASHDLQEPLRKLQTFGQMIMNREEAVFTEKGRDYFNRMIAAAQRMQGLLEALLNFSRTTTPNQAFEPTDLNQLLKDVQAELQEDINDKRARIEAGDLPVLSVVPFQFKQLLTNLISNALKYVQEGRPPHIRIYGDWLTEPGRQNGTDDRWFRLTVEDNGIGFEPEYKERVFELFARLHGKNEFSGSGIGLAICKKVAENHGGWIAAEGAPGLGAKFVVHLPEKLSREN